MAINVSHIVSEMQAQANQITTGSNAVDVIVLLKAIKALNLEIISVDSITHIDGLIEALESKANQVTTYTKTETDYNITTAIANLINGAPDTLNTLNEISIALNNNDDFAMTVFDALTLRATIESPTFTGTVSGITKAMVGLGNADNTSDVNKPISTAVQNALDTHTDDILNPHSVTKAQVELGNADNTSDIDKPVSTAQQTALNLKANIESPTFTGTVSGITKGMVGLGNADNTSDIDKPVSTAQQTALNLKANQSTTYSKTETDTNISTAISNLVNSAPGALDTLNELSLALGNDANFASTVANSLSIKAPINSPTFTGTVSGITSTMVGLGNVTNESKATMFTNPTFTGTTSGSFSGSLSGNATTSTTSTNLSGGTVSATTISSSSTITSGSGLGVSNSSSTTGIGLSLYGGATTDTPTYGLMFAGTSTFGTHGGVTSDWATYLTMSDTTNRGWIFRRGSSNVASIDGNGLFTGTATSALYADLAEKYLPDTEYSVGTVVMIGGEKEITSAQKDEKAIGVISENPAYMMNSELQGGQYVALKGRVPVKIDMSVKKGDKLIPSSNGFAKVSLNKDWNIFAIALEDSNSEFVEAIIL